MLIAPMQSATPMPRQVNRRIYFHTFISASKALRFTVEMRVGSGQVALPLHSRYAASGHMVQLKRSHPGINRGTFPGMGSKGTECPLWVKSRHVQCESPCPLFLQ